MTDEPKECQCQPCGVVSDEPKVPWTDEHRGVLQEWADSGDAELSEATLAALAEIARLAAALREERERSEDLVRVLPLLLAALPDSLPEGTDDESWEWCWEELSGEGQDYVKMARKTGEDALRAASHGKTIRLTGETGGDLDADIR